MRKSRCILATPSKVTIELFDYAPPKILGKWGFLIIFRQSDTELESEECTLPTCPDSYQEFTNFGRGLGFRVPTPCLSPRY